VAASTKYDLLNERNLETFMGFGYRSCCWAIRLFAQRRLDTEQRQVNDVKFEFELSGLSKLGDVPKSPLNQSIFFPSQEFATQGPGFR
jgi:LPS-assembly protein